MIMNRASAVALSAMQEGWAGPPFDPFSLAEFLRISVIPNCEVLDARTVPLSTDRLQIEYNPQRPRARIRYSVAHEIAHTLFPDCSERIRHRLPRQNNPQDDWELEMLCNLGAAEFLMPTGSLAEMQVKEFSLVDILELRKKFDVSTESILLRLLRITEQPALMFLASRENQGLRYRVNYSLASRATLLRIRSNTTIPRESVVAACTAINYKAAANEVWPGIGLVRVECLGIPPYPGSLYPRVIGLLRPVVQADRVSRTIEYITGDATAPKITGPSILAHVVNDTTPNWGAGFGRKVQAKWPVAHEQFRDAWQGAYCKNLGDIFLTEVKKNLSICQLVSQHGYGPSAGPRIRYAALRDCLLALRDKALTMGASIHMPRIGTGEAGGSWLLVSALIDEVLCSAGLRVTVYDLPCKVEMHRAQRGLFDSKS